MDCPECGALQAACQQRFDEFLALEFSDPGFGAVHHLTVAAFMLQHSSRLSREGWLYERGLLAEFLSGSQPDQVRRRSRDAVDSGKRRFKITSRSGDPVIAKRSWRMTLLDVSSADAETYRAGIRAWARSVLEESLAFEP